MLSTNKDHNDVHSSNLRINHRDDNSFSPPEVEVPNVLLGRTLVSFANVTFPQLAANFDLFKRRKSTGKTILEENFCASVVFSPNFFYCYQLRERDICK